MHIIWLYACAITCLLQDKSLKNAAKFEKRAAKAKGQPKAKVQPKAKGQPNAKGLAMAKAGAAKAKARLQRGKKKSCEALEADAAPKKRGRPKKVAKPADLAMVPVGTPDKGTSGARSWKPSPMALKDYRKEKTLKALEELLPAMKVKDQSRFVAGFCGPPAGFDKKLPDLMCHCVVTCTLVIAT